MNLYREECFHGTEKKYLDSIINDGFSESDSGSNEVFLGNGVYFMERYEENAWNYCLKVKRIPTEEIVVLRRIIQSENYLDLEDPVVLDYFIETHNDIEIRLKSELQCTYEITAGLVLQTLQNHAGYDFIKKSFSHGKIYGAKNSVNFGGIKPSSIYVCVKNKNCILKG